MDEPTLRAPHELEVDVPVGSVLPAALGDRPALSPEDLADEPLEFLAVEQTEIARPLEQVTTVASLQLQEEPAEDQRRGHQRAPEVGADKPQLLPVEKQRKGKPQACVAGYGENRHRTSRDALHDPEDQAVVAVLGFGHAPILPGRRRPKSRTWDTRNLLEGPRQSASPASRSKSSR